MVTQAIPRVAPKDHEQLAPRTHQRSNLPWDKIAELTAAAPNRLNVLSVIDCFKEDCKSCVALKLRNNAFQLMVKLMRTVILHLVPGIEKWSLLMRRNDVMLVVPSRTVELTLRMIFVQEGAISQQR